MTHWTGFTLWLLAGVTLFATSTAHSPEEKDFSRYDEIIPGTDLVISLEPIPAGSYLAGSPASEAGRNYDEGPQHEVQLAGFWMSAMEITWDQYEVFLYREKDGAIHPNPGDWSLDVDGVAGATMPYVNFNLPGHPVSNLTQYAASVFCEWLTAKTGRFYRLPTEAEWEYACRAGAATPYAFGEKESELGQFGWYAANSGGAFHPVGLKEPNQYGLYDMHGNVSEWVLDVYDSTVYHQLATGSRNPLVTYEVLYPHVYRGGSWMDGPYALRAANREYSDPGLKKRDPQFPKSLWWHTDAGHIGFRIVRPVESPTSTTQFRINPIEEY